MGRLFVIGLDLTPFIGIGIGYLVYLRIKSKASRALGHKKPVTNLTRD